MEVNGASSLPLQWMLEALPDLCDPARVQTEPCHYLEIGSTTEINDATLIHISSLKGFSSTGIGCTEKQLGHHPWMYLRHVWMWHLRKCLLVDLAVLG